MPWTQIHTFINKLEPKIGKSLAWHWFHKYLLQLEMQMSELVAKKHLHNLQQMRHYEQNRHLE